ncbi:MAG: ABC transporter ATP-binding protein [Lachnospiraceae bacterium]|nr:ABC transporter ATP-binding protein [Lachnospiraceae bacterium]
MSEYMIETKNIHKSFPIGNKETLEVLKGIDIVVPKGKLTILKGRSGSGKTTLLNILSMLDDATEGTFLIDDEDVSKMDSSQKETFRRYNIGFVFQSVALVPIMSAYENVDFGLKLAEYDGDKDARIKEVLGIVGLGGRMNHMPSQLSGGERQRVAIARAVAHKPKIIFADEPTGALDTAAGIAVMKLFRELIDREGITIVMTTHDPNLMPLGDVVYSMEDGMCHDATIVESNN